MDTNNVKTQITENQIPSVERIVDSLIKANLCWIVSVFFFKVFLTHQYDFLKIPFGIYKFGIGFATYGYVILPMVGIYYAITALGSDLKKVRTRAWIAFGCNCIVSVLIWLCWLTTFLFRTEFMMGQD